MSGLEPWFILSYPRCRTAWLSVFLQGAGVPSFHEAWKLVATPPDLRALMECYGPGPVVNSDSSNILFLPEIQAEFPDARYLVVRSDEAAVLASLRPSYGDHDYTVLMAAYRAAFARVGELPAFTVDLATWTADDSARIYTEITGLPAPQGWVTQMTGMLVQMMPEQIATDVQRVANGELPHIVEGMRRAHAWALA